MSLTIDGLQPTPPKSSRRSTAAGLLVLVAASTIALTIAFLASPATAETALTIETSTNGDDADSAPGPTLAPGDPVTWTYVVTVTGDTPLFDLIVSDDSGAVPDCDIDGDGGANGTRVHPGPLSNGQSFTCWATGTAPAGGLFIATGRVDAYDFDGNGPFEAADASHHTAVAPFNPEPAVTIESLVNGDDADGGPGPYLAQGTPMVITYVVTNTGNVPLTSIVVDNDAGLAVDCGQTDNVVAGPLAPGASVTCTSTAEAEAFDAGQQSAQGIVEANVDGGQAQAVSAVDPVVYTPVELPAALAFTGSGTVIAALGAVLLGLGGGLWLASAMANSRRRSMST